MPSEKIEKVVLKPFKMDPTQNHSQQELVRETERGNSLRDIKFREWIIVSVLCFVNLINYMDRFTLAGVLDKIKDYYQIDNDEGGLLQTAFILSYMLFAPLFGVLGDRYSRKWLMAFGVFLWCMTTLAGSFMTQFGWFVCFRALVGVGEGSYSTIAPTIISDYFVGDIRSKMLAFFYFAIPVGSGLGYIVGSEAARIGGQWQWALRVTPILGIIAVLLIIFLLEDPERGQSEHAGGHLETTTLNEDLKDIVHNRSFLYSTLGFTCVAFVAGALAWWGPLFVEKGIRLKRGSDVDTSDVPYKFGIISMIAGIVGVPFGSFVAQRLRPKYSRIDAYICSIGLLTSAPLVFVVCIIARYNTSLCFLVVFFAQFSFNMTWSIIADILLYVVIPTRRSTAQGCQQLFSHAFGDAGSPYLIGLLSERIKTYIQTSTSSENEIEFKSLQYALFTTCFVEVLGGIFFLINAFYIEKDRRKVQEIIASPTPPSSPIELEQEQLQAETGHKN